eukprot:scaffold7011_cov112-Isochrysis_galbana.AAC.30
MGHSTKPAAPLIMRRHQCRRRAMARGSSPQQPTTQISAPSSTRTRLLRRWHAVPRRADARGMISAAGCRDGCRSPIAGNTPCGIDFWGRSSVPTARPHPAPCRLVPPVRPDLARGRVHTRRSVLCPMQLLHLLSQELGSFPEPSLPLKRLGSHHHFIRARGAYRWRGQSVGCGRPTRCNRVGARCAPGGAGEPAGSRGQLGAGSRGGTRCGATSASGAFIVSPAPPVAQGWRHIPKESGRKPAAAQRAGTGVQAHRRPRQRVSVGATRRRRRCARPPRRHPPPRSALVVCRSDLALHVLNHAARRARLSPRVHRAPKRARLKVLTPVVPYYLAPLWQPKGGPYVPHAECHASGADGDDDAGRKSHSCRGVDPRMDSSRDEEGEESGNERVGRVLAVAGERVDRMVHGARWAVQREPCPHDGEQQRGDRDLREGEGGSGGEAIETWAKAWGEWRRGEARGRDAREGFPQDAVRGALCAA